MEMGGAYFFGMGPHLSAATPGPFTFSCSDCARSRGRCRSRSPESRSARSVESNRVARAERATGDQSRRPQQTESGPCVSLTVYTRNGGTPTRGGTPHAALRSVRNGAHATIHTQPHSDYHVAHSQWYTGRLSLLPIRTAATEQRTQRDARKSGWRG